MTITISPVKPPVDRYSYSNRASQGALIRQTWNWPRSCHRPEMFTHWGFACIENDDTPVTVPEGLGIDSFYMDRLSQSEWKTLMTPMSQNNTSGGGIVGLFQRCTEESLCKGVSAFSKVNVTSVRVVYYFNEATGYDCIRIDYLYKK